MGCSAPIKEFDGLAGGEVMVNSDTAINIGMFHSSEDTLDQSIERLGVRQRLFGVMVECATNGPERVRSYLSDLYHDATWVREMITGDKFTATNENGVTRHTPFIFYFGWDDMGTALGLNPSLVSCSRANIVRMVVELKDARWTVTVTPLKVEGEYTDAAK